MTERNALDDQKYRNILDMMPSVHIVGPWVCLINAKYEVSEAKQTSVDHSQTIALFSSASLVLITIQSQQNSNFMILEFDSSTVLDHINPDHIFLMCQTRKYCHKTMATQS